MDVKIYIGNAECTACGRRHRKVFEIDGKPYGSSCANKIIGKELTAPVWLYELAETWFQDEMKRFQGDASKVDYEGIAVNFSMMSRMLMPTMTVKRSGLNLLR